MYTNSLWLEADILAKLHPETVNFCQESICLCDGCLDRGVLQLNEANFRFDIELPCTLCLQCLMPMCEYNFETSAALKYQMAGIMHQCLFPHIRAQHP